MSNNNRAVTNKRTKEINKYRSETAYWHGLWSVLLKEVIWEGKEIDKSKVSRQTQTTTHGQKKEKRKESVIYIGHSSSSAYAFKIPSIKATECLSYAPSLTYLPYSNTWEISSKWYLVI